MVIDFQVSGPLPNDQKLFVDLRITRFGVYLKMGSLSKLGSKIEFWVFLEIWRRKSRAVKEFCQNIL